MTDATILIVDDEPLARSRLSRMIGRIGGTMLAGEAGDVDSAIRAIADVKPDILLLDIQLPGATGFDLLERLGNDVPSVIFVTAFDHYALRAFDTRAVDYVTKPVDFDRLAAAIERARAAAAARREDDRIAELSETVQALREALRAHENTSSDFWVRSRGERVRISSRDISCFIAEQDYVRLHADGGSHLIDESLTALERRLDPREFTRIHRATIVRTDRIARMRSAPFGGMVVVMTNGAELKVGKTYTARIRMIAQG